MPVVAGPWQYMFTAMTTSAPKVIVDVARLIFQIQEKRNLYTF